MSVDAILSVEDGAGSAAPATWWRASRAKAPRRSDITGRSAARGGAVRGAPPEGPRDHRRNRRPRASSARTTRTSAASRSNPSTRRCSRVEYMVPKGKHIPVQEGDFVQKGDYIMDGNPAPHDILRILGVEALADYLIDEMQDVYRLQGVKINDKHIEVIVRQMLQKCGDPRTRATRRCSRANRSRRSSSTRRTRRRSPRAAVRHRASRSCWASPRPRCRPGRFISAASFQETTRVLTEAVGAGQARQAGRPEGERDRRAA